MKNDINYSLYLVTDQSLLKKKTLQKAVQQALEGGITVLQLREKKPIHEIFMRKRSR